MNTTCLFSPLINLLCMFQVGFLFQVLSNENFLIKTLKNNHNWAFYFLTMSSYFLSSPHFPQNLKIPQGLTQSLFHPFTQPLSHSFFLICSKNGLRAISTINLNFSRQSSAQIPIRYIVFFSRFFNSYFFVLTSYRALRTLCPFEDDL